eukprot:GHVN01081554.1.p1 GENE.GHVN01081554.1~~GHVN01081554.1.p1  ORF type:complete len:2233 (+),score=565.79 GHVN01081554.1:104-6802(+)
MTASSTTADILKIISQSRGVVRQTNQYDDAAPSSPASPSTASRPLEGRSDASVGNSVSLVKAKTDGSLPSTQSSRGGGGGGRRGRHSRASPYVDAVLGSGDASSPGSGVRKPTYDPTSSPGWSSVQSLQTQPSPGESPKRGQPPPVGESGFSATNDTLECEGGTTKPFESPHQRHSNGPRQPLASQLGKRDHDMSVASMSESQEFGSAVSTPHRSFKGDNLHASVNKGDATLSGGLPPNGQSSTPSVSQIPTVSSSPHSSPDNNKPPSGAHGDQSHQSRNAFDDRFLSNGVEAHLGSPLHFHGSSPPLTAPSLTPPYHHMQPGQRDRDDHGGIHITGITLGRGGHSPTHPNQLSHSQPGHPLHTSNKGYDSVNNVQSSRQAPQYQHAPNSVGEGVGPPSLVCRPPGYQSSVQGPQIPHNWTDGVPPPHYHQHMDTLSSSARIGPQQLNQHNSSSQSPNHLNNNHIPMSAYPYNRIPPHPSGLSPSLVNRSPHIGGRMAPQPQLSQFSSRPSCQPHHNPASTLNHGLNDPIPIPPYSITQVGPPGVSSPNVNARSHPRHPQLGQPNMPMAVPAIGGYNGPLSRGPCPPQQMFHVAGQVQQGGGGQNKTGIVSSVGSARGGPQLPLNLQSQLGSSQIGANFALSPSRQGEQVNIYSPLNVNQPSNLSGGSTNPIYNYQAIPPNQTPSGGNGAGWLPHLHQGGAPLLTSPRGQRTISPQPQPGLPHQQFGGGVPRGYIMGPVPTTPSSSPPQQQVGPHQQPQGRQQILNCEWSGPQQGKIGMLSETADTGVMQTSSMRGGGHIQPHPHGPHTIGHPRPLFSQHLASNRDYGPIDSVMASPMSYRDIAVQQLNQMHLQGAHERDMGVESTGMDTAGRQHHLGNTPSLGDTGMGPPLNGYPQMKADNPNNSNPSCHASQLHPYPTQSLSRVHQGGAQLNRMDGGVRRLNRPPHVGMKGVTGPTGAPNSPPTHPCSSPQPSEMKASSRDDSGLLPQPHAHVGPDGYGPPTNRIAPNRQAPSDSGTGMGSSSGDADVTNAGAPQLKRARGARGQRGPIGDEDEERLVRNSDNHIASQSSEMSRDIRQTGQAGPRQRSGPITEQTPWPIFNSPNHQTKSMSRIFPLTKAHKDLIMKNKLEYPAPWSRRQLPSSAGHTQLMTSQELDGILRIQLTQMAKNPELQRINSRWGFASNLVGPHLPYSRHSPCEEQSPCTSQSRNADARNLGSTSTSGRQRFDTLPIGTGTCTAGVTSSTSPLEQQGLVKSGRSPNSETVTSDTGRRSDSVGGDECNSPTAQSTQRFGRTGHASSRQPRSVIDLHSLTSADKLPKTPTPRSGEASVTTGSPTSFESHHDQFLVGLDRKSVPVVEEGIECGGGDGVGNECRKGPGHANTGSTASYSGTERGGSPSFTSLAGQGDRENEFAAMSRPKHSPQTASGTASDDSRLQMSRLVATASTLPEQPMCYTGGIKLTDTGIQLRDASPTSFRDRPERSVTPIALQRAILMVVEEGYDLLLNVADIRAEIQNNPKAASSRLEQTAVCYIQALYSLLSLRSLNHERGTVMGLIDSVEVGRGGGSEVSGVVNGTEMSEVTSGAIKQTAALAHLYIRLVHSSPMQLRDEAGNCNERTGTPADGETGTCGVAYEQCCFLLPESVSLTQQQELHQQLTSSLPDSHTPLYPLPSSTSSVVNILHNAAHPHTTLSLWSSENLKRTSCLVGRLASTSKGAQLMYRSEAFLPVEGFSVLVQSMFSNWEVLMGLVKAGDTAIADDVTSDFLVDESSRWDSTDLTHLIRERETASGDAFDQGQINSQTSAQRRAGVGRRGDSSSQPEDRHRPSFPPLPEMAHHRRAVKRSVFAVTAEGLPCFTDTPLDVHSHPSHWRHIDQGRAQHKTQGGEASQVTATGAVPVSSSAEVKGQSKSFYGGCTARARLMCRILRTIGAAGRRGCCGGGPNELGGEGILFCLTRLLVLTLFGFEVGVVDSWGPSTQSGFEGNDTKSSLCKGELSVDKETGTPTTDADTGTSEIAEIGLKRMKELLQTRCGAALIILLQRSCVNFLRSVGLVGNSVQSITREPHSSPGWVSVDAVYRFATGLDKRGDDGGDGEVRHGREGGCDDGGDGEVRDGGEGRCDDGGDGEVRDGGEGGYDDGDDGEVRDGGEGGFDDGGDGEVRDGGEGGCDDGGDGEVRDGGEGRCDDGGDGEVRDGGEGRRLDDQKCRRTILEMERVGLVTLLTGTIVAVVMR